MIFADFKGKKPPQKISMLTCYDYSTAKWIDGEVDIILVGDSLGMVILGYPDTTSVTMEDMLRATAAVSRGVKKSLIVADLPYKSYQTENQALENAKRLIDCGAQAIKIENSPEIAAFLVKNKISTMGHVGLTPQTIEGFKYQGKTDEQAEKIFKTACELEKAAVFSVVLECIPENLAAKITQQSHIPTIGIGAGENCDGQVLVIHDILGLYPDFQPKFAKKYLNLGELIKNAVQNYNSEVKNLIFPD